MTQPPPTGWEQRLTLTVPGPIAEALTRAAQRDLRDLKSQALVMLAEALRRSGDLAAEERPA